MGPAATGTLYDEVVYITHEYFGPAADRFVSRQISTHLRKSPRTLHKKDLASLIDWIALAISVLIEDEQLVGEYVTELRSLARTGLK